MVPIAEKPVWISTGPFMQGAMTPSARKGDIKKFAERLVDWLVNGLPSGDEVSIAA